jgi:DNA-binding MarR family transcriptional regulator
MAFQLTSRGTQEATNLGRRAGPESTILAFLYELGDKPAEAEEIMDHTHMDDEKTIRVLKRLINEELIEEV